MVLFFDTLFFPVLFVVGCKLNKIPIRKILVDSSLFFIIVAILAAPFLVSYSFSTTILFRGNYNNFAFKQLIRLR